MSLLKRTAEVLIGNTVARVLLLAFELSFVSALGTKTFGNWSILFSLLMFTSGLAVCGLDYGVIHFLATYQTEKGVQRARTLIRGVLAVTCIAGLLVGAGIFLAAPFIANSILDKPELVGSLRLVSLILPLEAMNLLIGSALRGERHFRQSVIVTTLIRNGCLFCLAPMFFVFAISLEHAVSLLLAGSSVACLYGLFSIRHLAANCGGKNNDWSFLTDVCRYSFPLLMCNVFSRFAPLAVFLAGVYLKAADVGVFALMLSLLVLFTFPQRAVAATAPVEFARLFHLGRHERLAALYHRVSRGMMIVSSFIAIPLTVASATLLPLWKPEMEHVSLLFLPLIAIQLCSVGMGPVGQLLIYTQGNWVFLRISTLVVVVQLTLFTVLAPSFGLTGVVIAQCSTMLVNLVIRHLASFRNIGIHSMNIGSFALLAMAALSSSVGLSCGMYERSLACGLTSIVIALIVYVVLLVLAMAFTSPHSLTLIASRMGIVRFWDSRSDTTITPETMLPKSHNPQDSAHAARCTL